MAIEKKSLRGAGQAKSKPDAAGRVDPAVKTGSPAKLVSAKKLALAKLVTAKLSTARLVTAKKLNG
jgi:hypothetical protein